MDFSLTAAPAPWPSAHIFASSCCRAVESRGIVNKRPCMCEHLCILSKLGVALSLLASCIGTCLPTSSMSCVSGLRPSQPGHFENQTFRVHKAWFAGPPCDAWQMLSWSASKTLQQHVVLMWSLKNLRRLSAGIPKSPAPNLGSVHRLKSARVDSHF